jgi:hypothetical protein
LEEDCWLNTVSHSGNADAMQQEVYRTFPSLILDVILALGLEQHHLVAIQVGHVVGEGGCCGQMECHSADLDLEKIYVDAEPLVVVAFVAAVAAVTAVDVDEERERQRHAVYAESMIASVRFGYSGDGRAPSGVQTQDQIQTDGGVVVLAAPGDLGHVNVPRSGQNVDEKTDLILLGVVALEWEVVAVAFCGCRI